MAAAGLAACLLVAAPVWPQAQADVRSADTAAAGASTDEIRALDKQVQIILAEARRQQEQLAVQRQRLAAAEAANGWLPWLVLGLVALAALAAGLGLRLWHLQRRMADAPGKADALPPASPDTPASAGPDAAVPRDSDRPLLSATATGPASAPGDLTLAQPRLLQAPLSGSEPGLSTRDFSMGSGVPQRPVSVEELLDLDQQADFFLALGQAQSAVDLLLSHVRGTGGTSALPYFKLLEIYRQEGDEGAYERTRERFNQRFNAQAPDWSGDLAGGRHLEDYPDVVLRLQHAWPHPMRAVAELEGLLLRRADLEPFDLPAYRDVLMLHALVRDMPALPAPSASPATTSGTTPAVLAHAPAAGCEPAPSGTDAVDLFLPLGDGPLDITAPRPHLSERGSAQAMLADWVFTRAALARAPADPLASGSVFDRAPASSSRPMALDLDLSDHAPAPREFTRPAAFTDIDMRHDRRLSDLGGLDEIDSDPTPLPSRR